MHLYKSTTIFYILAFLLSGQLKAQNSSSSHLMTLDEIWTISESQNRQLKLSGLSRRESNLSVLEAKDKLLPELSVAGDAKLNSKFLIYDKGLFSSPEDVPVSGYGYSLGYSFNINLFNGGRDRRNIKIKQEEDVQRQYEFDLQKNNIKYAAAAAYYDLYKFLQFKNFILAEIMAEKKQLSTIQNLHKNGVVLKSDVLRTSVKLSQLELNYSDVEKKIAIDKQRLNVLMGRSEDLPLDIPYQDSISIQHTAGSGYTDYLNIALRESPQYKIVYSNIKLSELNARQVEAARLPRISAYSNYNYTYPQISFYPYSNDLWGFGQTGIKMQFPIDNLYKSRHSIARARVNTDQQKENALIKRDEISLQVREAYLQLQQAAESVETAKKNMIQSSEAVRVIRNSYMNQESLLTDLMDAENMLLETKFNLTSALVNLKLSHLRLLAITGIL